MQQTGSYCFLNNFQFLCYLLQLFLGGIIEHDWFIILTISNSFEYFHYISNDIVLIWILTTKSNASTLHRKVVV